MASFHFRPAERGVVPILMGISGGTGSGKTFSALRVAAGLSDRIAFVDTERGRARHYAKHFRFDHALLLPPYSPEQYIEALDAAEAHVGPGGAVIMDSCSHLWESEGGLLETAQQTAHEMYERAVEKAEKNGRATDWITPDSFTYPSWREPKQRNQKWVNRVLQANCHIIFCFRAKEKRKMVKNGNKTELTSLGVLPIIEESFPYEMTLFAMLSWEAQGVPIFSNVGKPLSGEFREIFRDRRPLDEDHGRALAAWSADAEAQPAPAKPAAASEHKASPADFWTRESLAIPMGGDQVKWRDRMAKAVAGAPTVSTLSRLQADNQLSIQAAPAHLTGPLQTAIRERFETLRTQLEEEEDSEDFMPAHEDIPPVGDDRQGALA